MKKRRSKGQVLPFVAIVVLVLAMFVVVLVNIFQIEYARQRAQIAADAGALTFMRTRASYMNMASITNALAYTPGLGLALFPGGFLWHNEGKWLVFWHREWGTVIAPAIFYGIPTGVALRIQAASAVLTYWVKANNLQASIACKQAAKDNSANPYNCEVSAVTWPGLVVGNKTGLTEQKIKLITTSIIPDPLTGMIPIVDPTYDLLHFGYKPEGTNFGIGGLGGHYECRTWQKGTRNAQPKKDDGTPYDFPAPTYITVKCKIPPQWGSSIISLQTADYAYANANAMVYLNVKKDAKVGLFGLGVFNHNGGFPRKETSEGWAGGKDILLGAIPVPGIEPMAAYPKFDAVLIPVGPLLH